jgi:transcriptional regulator with XRE-family HTH domain
LEEEMAQAGLGSRLKLAARRAGMNSERLGEALGISAAAVRQWWREHSEPSAAQVVAYARATNVSVRWLLEGPGPPSQELVEWAVRFADRVLAGEGPARALERLTGAALSDDERERLERIAGPMRTVLSVLAPGAWDELSTVEKWQVLERLREIAEQMRRPRPSAPKPDEGHAP